MNRLAILSFLLLFGLSAPAPVAAVNPSVRIETDLNFANDICTDPHDISTCDTPVSGRFQLTVAPNEPIHLTVRCENTGTLSLINHEVDIPDLGAVGSSPNFLLSGETITFRTVLWAPTVPGSYFYVVAYTAEDLFGTPVTDFFPIYIDVDPPTAEVLRIELYRAADACTNPTDVSSCDVPADLGNDSLVIASGDDLYIRVICQNTSPRVLTNQFATIPGLGDLEGEPDIPPGVASTFQAVFPVPIIPGEYNYRLRYTAEDLYGNPVVAIGYFVVEVIAVSAAVDIRVYLAEDLCTDLLNPGSCQPGMGGSGVITSGAGQPLYLQCFLINSGTVPLRNNRVDIPGLGSFPGPQGPVAPGDISFFGAIFPAPATEGTHHFTATYTGETTAGYSLAEDEPLILRVSCVEGDFVPPAVVCRDISLNLLHQVSGTISAADVTAGAIDNCNAAPTLSLDATTFTCADLGEQTVTLTAEDVSGNSSNCTATVTVMSEENVSLGPVDQCMAVVVNLPGPGFVDVFGPEGRLITSVAKGNNPGVQAVRIALYREAAAVVGDASDLRLSRRFQFTTLDAAGVTVAPTNPLPVRLYYREAELAALETAAGADRGTFQIVRTSGDCDDGFDGRDLPLSNTQYGNRGCLGENQFYETASGGNDLLLLFANPAALPVTLTSFTATAQPKDEVRLDWTTSTETNNDHFLIERSTDGIIFTQVGAVAGARNALTEHRYTFLDVAPMPGRNYYRLRQVDLDGTASLSEVRQVTIANHQQLILYPNPATSQLYLTGFAGGSVRVLDSRGRVVLERSLAPGEPLALGSLARGVYLLRVAGTVVRWVKA